MRNILFIFSLFLSQYALAQSGVLLSQQPILSQMTGNCYTHSGTDVLTGVYLKRNGATSVNQPHPLLLGGIISGHVGRANLSSGNTCAFFNEAKKTSGEVCSVQAFNRFVATRPGMTPAKLSENVDTLDKALSSLQSLFDKGSWNGSDRAKAKKNAGDIISAVCNLNGVVDMSNPKFAELIDDARNIIETLSPRQSSSFGDLIPRGASEFADMVFSGFGPYLFRRGSDLTGYVGEAIEFNRERRTTINRVLNESYQNMNSRCVAYARANNLPRVPSNFFSLSSRFTCTDDMFMKPRLSVERMKPKLASIEGQVRAGYATPISVCSAGFYGKYPKVSGYRKSDGDCENGGGHAVTVTGVVTRNGKKMFRIRNSWGVDACRSVANGRRVCARSGQSGCPSSAALDCENGVFYMSEDYLSKVMYRFGRLSY